MYILLLQHLKKNFKGNLRLYEMHIRREELNKGNGKLYIKELTRHFREIEMKSRSLVRPVAHSQTGNA